MIPAPFGAVREEHICSLRFRKRYPLKVIPEIINGIAYIFRQYTAQFVHPLRPFLPISSNQSMHRQDIHIIIMTKGRFLEDTLPQPLVIDNVIASNETRQVKSL